MKKCAQIQSGLSTNYGGVRTGKLCHMGQCALKSHEVALGIKEVRVVA